MMIFFGGRNIEYDLRTDLLTHLLKVDMDFYRRNAVGDLMSRFTSDLGQVRLLIGPGILNMVNSVIVFSGALFLMINQSPSLTLYSLIPYVPAIFIARYVSLAIYRRNLAVQRYLGRFSDYLQQVLNGLFVVHSFGREAGFFAKFKLMAQELFDKTLNLVKIRMFFFPFMMSLASFGMAIILWKGGQEVATGKMTIGQYVKFTSYFALLSWPTVAFGWMLSLWQRGMSGLERIYKLFEIPFEASGKEELAKKERQKFSLKWENFEGPYGVGPINAQIESGKTILIVGPTGSGKSIFLETLMAYFPIQNGELKVNGVDFKKFTIESFRDLFAYVPQESFLFSRSIKENIAFGVFEPEKSPFKEAAQMAGVEDDILRFPEQFQTLVGEKGITLSGGQRQRMSLARAFLSEAPILVLDDALSALDVETERKILLGLKSKLKGKQTGAQSAIIVSQRLSMVDLADEIWVLNKGRIEDKGSHEELLSKNKLYRNLYELQSMVTREEVQFGSS